MPSNLTVDQMQKVERDMAAATVRNLAAMIDEIAPNIFNPQEKEDFKASVRGLRALANRISEGRVNRRRWEFLTWLQEPKVNLDGFPVLDATFAEIPSSGSKIEEVESESPSTKSDSTSPEESSSESIPIPPW